MRAPRVVIAKSVALGAARLMREMATMLKESNSIRGEWADTTATADKKDHDALLAYADALTNATVRKRGART